MLADLRFSHISAGFIAVLVGYSSSVAIVFQAAAASGVEGALLNSWLLSLGLAMGLTSLCLSLMLKIPVLTAWSTPGAALLALSLGDFSVNEASGIFIFAAALSLVLGLSGLLERIMKLIPPSLSNALLAGVLLPIGLDVFVHLQEQTLLVALMLVCYVLAKRYSPRYAIVLVLLCGLGLTWSLDLYSAVSFDYQLPKLIWTHPEFNIAGMIGVGIPLFLVTLSSQNITGLAVMRAKGYKPPTSVLLNVSSAMNLLLAPFGCFSIGLAAITAAICMTEDADENPGTRYLASACAGVFYLLSAFAGLAIILLFTASPPALVAALAGIALFATIGNSMQAAFESSSDREAALVTFLVTASSFSFMGLSAPFWGLSLGLLLRALRPNKR
ncbi:benzoate/H(+) symporter BenE family transporter [Alginatibacterium sediminis]|nr:benzoate/H(+) symporter BenE family transporter [Alginatibacterium sediminis]